MTTYRLLTDLKGPKGDPGVGVKGDRGATGTFQSASAVQVAAGQPADAIVSGPENAKHLTVVMPRPLPAPDAVPTIEAVEAMLATRSEAPRQALERAWGRVVSVDEQGAVGDGVADDTQAVRSALAAAATLGIRHVHLEHTYKTHSIVVPAGVTLSGPGRLVWHEQSPAGTPFVTLFGHIEGVTLDGARAANPRTNHRSQDAIVLIHPDAIGASVLDAQLLNGPSSGIWGDLGASGVRVQGTLIRNCRNYNVSIRGDQWIVSGNTMMGGTNGVRIGSWVSEFQANPTIREFRANIVSNNTIYGTQSVPFEIEINSRGTVIDGNTILLCNGVTKIQYQVGEPVYDTTFANNYFLEVGYPVAFDDATGKAVQNTSGSMITAIPFGGFNTTVYGNTIRGAAGVIIEGGTWFMLNQLLDIGADATGTPAAMRIAATSERSRVFLNRLRLHPTKYIHTLVRIDAPSAWVVQNDLQTRSDVTYLIAFYGANGRGVDNAFLGTGGAFLVPSTTAGVRIIDNDLPSITAAFGSSVNRLAPGLMIRGNTGTSPTPDLAANLDVVSNAITVRNGSKFSVGSGTDGVAASLTTLVGGDQGQWVLLQRRSSAQVVTVNSGGNIRLRSGAFVLGAQNKISLKFDGAEWLEEYRF